MYGCRGKDGERIVRKFGIDMCTLLYLKWITRGGHKMAKE